MDSKTEVKSGWTTEQEARIQHFIERGQTRSNAVRSMRNEERKAAAPVIDQTPVTTQATVDRVNKALASKRTVSDADVDRMSESEAKTLLAPKAKKSDRAKSSSKYALTPAQKAAATKAVNEVRGKGAVDRQLKSSLNPKYAVYQYFGLSDGNVCHVSFGEEVTAHLLPEKSVTVRNWRAQLKRDAKS